MKREIEIRRRLSKENDAFAIEVLRWVLDGGCAFCEHTLRKDFELALKNQDYEPTYLETKYGWEEGTVIEHLDNHIEYDPQEANHVESARVQSISTLDAAEDIVIRIQGYLNELEEQKQLQGGAITSDFVSDAAKLIGQANTSLKLVGQLKKEIGVDSQLMLAQAQTQQVTRILVDTLKEHPQLLDKFELQMAALKAPTVIDPSFEVIE